MRLPMLLGGSLAALLLGPLACGGTASNNVVGGGDDGGATTGDSGSAACTGCNATSDCSGGAACVDMTSGRFCAPPCGSGTSCASGASCVTVTQAGGGSVQACVPSDECVGAGGGGTSGGSSGGVAWDGGGPVTGTVGSNGGTLSSLYFGVVGDTRPPSYDDVAGYPTSVIQQIFTALALPQFNPPFLLATGDYQFASSGSGSTASQQLSLYLGARTTAGYTGTQFPAMGNHECTGATDSNCGSGNGHGVTANYSAFMSQMLAPIQKTQPYYSINVDAADGSWTSKFVFVAANAWDSGQQSWLTTTMAQKTTYTFVIRHESSETTGGPPGLAGSDAILATSPYTLLIVGHSHTFAHYGSNPREVIIGNGGAPLTGNSKYFGFGVFKQRPDGAIVADMINKDAPYAPDHSFHFAVKPDGTITN